MNELLQQKFFGNTLQVYLIVIGIILFAVLVKRYLSRYIAGLLFRLVQRIAAGVDKAPFINLVVQPLETFLLILVTMVALESSRIQLFWSLKFTAFLFMQLSKRFRSSFC